MTEPMDTEVMGFIYDNIYGWIGNLWRDLDAQGIEVDPMAVAWALRAVAEEIDPEDGTNDFDGFLAELEEERDCE